MISSSVCPCVCLSVSISLELLDRCSGNFFCRSPWSWLSPPWRRYSTLCTSGFMDDVMFGHNGRYGDAWLGVLRYLMSMNTLLMWRHYRLGMVIHYLHPCLVCSGGAVFSGVCPRVCVSICLCVSDSDVIMKGSLWKFSWFIWSTLNSTLLLSVFRSGPTN